MRCRRAITALSGLWVVLGVSPSLAQVTEPEPLVVAQPQALVNRAGVELEGWVVVRYSVLADGRTDSVEAIDRQPPQLPYREVVAAVEDWVFEPARADGEAIEWHNNEALVLLRSAESPNVPTSLFLQGYREAQAQMDEGNFGRALRSSEDTLEAATRLVEIGLAYMQQSMIHLQLGDRHAAYAAIRHATDPRAPTLQGQDLNVALQYRNVLEMQLNDLFGVLETLERRNALAPVPSDDPVAASAASVEQALSQGSTIAQKAKILDRAWRHALGRRAFAIGAVNGDIDAIEVSCDRRSAELQYTADSEWTLPESWGDCVVAVIGRDDTEFEFYEFQ